MCVLKQNRRDQIIDIIKNHAITTQEELLEKLRENGYEVTQATVSRDIKKIGLIKAVNAKGVMCYTLPSESKKAIEPKFSSIFSNSVISVARAMNDVVIKCYSGMANAACAALDSMEFEEIVGSLAGDDTILIIAQNEEAAVALCEKLKTITDYEK